MSPKETYRYLHGLSPSIILIFKIKESCNFRNFQALYSSNKKQCNLELKLKHIEFLKFGTRFLTILRIYLLQKYSKRKSKSEKAKYFHVLFVKITYKTSIFIERPPLFIYYQHLHSPISAEPQKRQQFSMTLLVFMGECYIYCMILELIWTINYGSYFKFFYVR